MSQLWDQLHDLFDTDDGSLPDIELNNLSGDQVENIYAYLRSRSEIVSTSPCFWSIAEQREIAVDAVDNAARLVARSEAEAFHIVLGGLSYDGATVPALGVFVSDDSILLDYRMGPDWGPAELEALFKCLRRIQELAPSVEVALPAGKLASVRERFSSALWQYQNSGAV